MSQHISFVCLWGCFKIDKKKRDTLHLLRLKDIKLNKVSLKRRKKSHACLLWA